MKQRSLLFPGVFALGLGMALLNTVTLRWVVGPAGDLPQLQYGFPLPWAAGSLGASLAFEVAPAIFVVDAIVYAGLLFPLAFVLLNRCREKARRLIVLGTWLLACGLAGLFFVPNEPFWRLWLSPSPLREVRFEARLSAGYRQFYEAE